MKFSRQEYWSGLPFPLQGIFLTQGLNSGFLHCRQILYRLSHQGNPSYLCTNYLCCNIKKFTCPIFLSSNSTLCTCFHRLNLVGYTIVDLYVFVVGDNYNHWQHQFSSVTQLCLTLCNPMDCSMLGLPVHHQIPEFTQTYPLSQWCHPTISSSVVPFSSCPQSFPALGSFQMSQFFTSGGQSIGASASASVLPMNIQGWFPLGLPGLISLQSKGLSGIFSNITVQKHQFLGTQLFF